MDKKMTGILLLGGAVAAAAYYFYTTSSTSGWTPPPGANMIPPGGSYGGVQNTTQGAIYMTATGELLNSLGQAFSTVYGAVTTAPKTT